MNEEVPGARWPTWVYSEGDDPDPRFSLANERTFLAWIRTSLALVAAGMGVDAFATDVPTWGRRSLAGLLIVLGGSLALFAFQRWYRSEQAIRLSLPLPVNRLALTIALGLSIGAGLALVLILVES
jgi:putative membrane protein